VLPQVDLGFHAPVVFAVYCARRNLAVFHMNKIPKLVLLAAIALSFSGCANVDVTKTASGFYDATNPNNIEILKTKPERKFIELGTVTVTGFKSNEAAKMHNAIRAKSAPLGANAVILTDEGITPAGLGSYVRWATGVAIRYN
jgi:hypothetical protein